MNWSRTIAMTEPMTLLFDVNVLLALTHAAHVHHDRVHGWWSTRADTCQWATTPVTEAGLVRLLSNPAVTGERFPMSDCLDMLRRVRQAPGHSFLIDDTSLAEPAVALSHLQGHRQVTDLHLLNLAARHNAVLATLDVRLSNALPPTDARHLELVQHS